jgi:hypothetical protein
MVDGKIEWDKRGKRIKTDYLQFYNSIYFKSKIISVIFLLSVYASIYAYSINNLIFLPVFVFYGLYITSNIYSAYYMMFRENLFQTYEDYLKFIDEFLRINHFKISKLRSIKRSTYLTLVTDDISHTEMLDVTINKRDFLTKLNFNIEILTASGVYEKLENKFENFSFFFFSNYDFIYIVQSKVSERTLKFLYIISIVLTLCEVFDLIIFYCISNSFFTIKRKISENQITYLIPSSSLTKRDFKAFVTDVNISASV